MNIQFYKDGSSIVMQCSQNDVFAEVVLRYIQKLGLNDVGNLKFFFNSKQLGLYDCKSLAENNLYNNAVIQVTTGVPQQMNNPFQNQSGFGGGFNPGNMGGGQNMNMNIIFVINGRKIMVQGQQTTKFCELVQKFSVKADLKPTDIPKFILNSMQVPPNDQRTLSQLKMRDQGRVEVFLEQEVIGA